VQLREKSSSLLIDCEEDRTLRAVLVWAVAGGRPLGRAHAEELGDVNQAEELAAGHPVRIGHVPARAGSANGRGL
jgi:hypothetical protein